MYDNGRQALSRDLESHRHEHPILQDGRPQSAVNDARCHMIATTCDVLTSSTYMCAQPLRSVPSKNGATSAVHALYAMCSSHGLASKLKISRMRMLRHGCLDGRAHEISVGLCSMGCSGHLVYLHKIAARDRMVAPCLV